MSSGVTSSVDLLEPLSTNFFKLSQPKSKSQAPKRTKEVIDLQENVALRGDSCCTSRPESQRLPGRPPPDTWARTCSLTWYWGKVEGFVNTGGGA